MASFRSRLFTISLTLLVVFVAGLGVYLHQVLRAWTETVIQEDVEVRVQMAVDAMKLAPEDLEAEAFVEAFDDIEEQRITVVDADGDVQAATHMTADQIEATGSFGDRPEIARALQGEKTVVQRHNESIGQEMLNVAIPDLDDEGAIRVSVPLREVDEAIAGLRVLLLIGIVVGLGGSILISGIAARLMSKILRDVLDRARADAALEASPAPISKLFQFSHDNSLRQITEALEETLDELAAERNRLRAILDGMNEGLVVTDEALNITLSNSTVHQLLGIDAEPEGESLTRWMCDEIVEKMVQHPDEHVEFEVASPRSRRIQAHATRRSKAGGYIIVFHDVTAIRELEQVRRDFVANVSHELRTPVTIIQANAETLLDGALEVPEYAGKFTRRIHQNARRLGRLISDLLDLSRIEDGEVDLTVEPLDVQRLVQQTIEGLREGPATDDADIEWSVQPGLEVRADWDGLGQVLTNLLENALNYGGDDVTVEVDAAVRGDEVVIEVRDDGPGVDPEDRERIFERFYRGDAPVGDELEQAGTGLGLSIVKHLVESMGGEVGYRDAEGGGAVFRVSLPAA